MSVSVRVYPMRSSCVGPTVMRFENLPHQLDAPFHRWPRSQTTSQSVTFVGHATYRSAEGPCTIKTFITIFEGPPRCGLQIQTIHYVCPT